MAVLVGFLGLKRIGSVFYVAIILILGCFVPTLAGQATILPTPKPMLDIVKVLPEPKPLPKSPYDRLSKNDAARYSNIFALQELAEWEKADEAIAELGDMRLMGHVLYQRYMHPTAYRSNFKELKVWLDHYKDHPGAKRIYNLAFARKPDAARAPDKSREGYGVTGRLDINGEHAPEKYVSSRRRNSAKKIRIRDLKRLIRRDLRRDAPTKAYSRLQTEESVNLFDKVEYDILRADIAASYFYVGKKDKAYELSVASADRSGRNAPLAGWIAGLSSWSKGDYSEAAKHFEQPASSKRSSAYMSSAGSYWAARSYTRARQPQKVSYWLKKAVDHPRSFYGLLAARSLGVKKIKYDWSAPIFTARHIKVLSSLPAGNRALALLDANQPQLAEKELRRIHAGDNKVLKEALVAIADVARLPALALQAGSSIKKPGGSLYDVALYPMSPWYPSNGLKLDQALLNAFIRQESRFDPTVSSRSGATGLMQLMPTTASYISGMPSRHFKGKAGKRKLEDPVFNMELGQKYLDFLLDKDHVDNNLFNLAIAYNAGPGRLARWQKKVNTKDPLLFIESIPAKETRMFVEKVVANYWIYRLRLGQKTPSLASVVSGKPPLYTQQDTEDIKVAAYQRSW